MMNCNIRAPNLPPPNRAWSVAAMVMLASLCACASPRPPAAVKPPSPVVVPVQPPATAAQLDERCDGAPAFASAAQYNAVSETSLDFSPFGRPETGWAVYEPLVAESIGSHCLADSQNFAAAVARWQARHGLTPDGALSPETFQTLKGVWQERRPFVMLRVQHICPPGADEASLVTLNPEETLGGPKPVRLRPAALEAYRRMVAAARLEAPPIAADPDLLGAFSGYRSPAADDARCEAEGNCQGMVRAQCSAHRTGLAIDLDVGALPGAKLDDSSNANRIYQSRGAAYRWMVRNAARFGFVPYPFEPWHWEWTGESP